MDVDNILLAVIYGLLLVAIDIILRPEWYKGK